MSDLTNRNNTLHTRLGNALTQAYTDFSVQPEQATLVDTDNGLQTLEAGRNRFTTDNHEIDQKNQAILQALPDTLGIVNWNGDILYYHAGSESKFIPSEQVLFKNIHEYLPAELADELLKIFRGVIESGQVQIHEYSITFAKNDIRYYQDKITPCMENSVLVISRDVTKQKQIEDDLRTSEARFRSLVETQNEIIGRFTADGTITFVNEAINRLVGVPASDLIGHNIFEFVAGVDRQEAQEALIYASQRTPGNSTKKREIKITTPAGNKLHIEAVTQAIFNDQEKIIEFQATVHDITTLKYAQETLEHQNELLRQLSDQLINIQENERQRIARELHDSVLSELGVMMIAPAERLTPQAVRGNYELLIEQLRQTINGLRSPMLNYGLFAALDDLLDSMMDNPLAKSEFSMEIPASLARFDLNIELHLFRIIQQACDNAIQHARAPHIRIHGNIDEGCVNLTVEDDGIGFQLGTETDLAHILAQKHFGLFSMLERGKLIGANVQITSHPGAGTQVHVLWEPQND
jgi:PAS domain S-box-containing protein